ncbi:MAG: DUF349 domain-containing protein [Prevotella sp.]|nr:DUF349 domain-containing protein [Prevotella sp.]
MMDSQENVLNQEAQLEENKVVENQVENAEPAEISAEEPAAVEEQPVVEAETVEVPEEQPAEEAETPEEQPVAEAETAEELPVEEVETVEEQLVEEDAEEQSADGRKVYATKKEVIERLQELAHGDENPTKDEVDYLKTTFYKLHFAQREAEQKAYLEAGGDPEKYVVAPDMDEETFKAEMGVVKEKRQKLFQQQEEEKLENLKKKQAIIEKIKNMITSPEEANRRYQEFKQLQQEWKEIKLVPAEKANELWRNYQLYVEQYYDLLKLNSEAREYDFKKNLEVKTRLCEAAEKLDQEEDVISAFHQLQKLHQEFRETGPVAKELREEIWTRFKAASTVINKKHQQHFENIRSKEEDNLARKTELCEKVEAIAKEENKGAGDWEKHTKQIIEIQAQWKTIGFAPQKMNVKIFERFRAACDDFFAQKAEYFKSLKARFSENAAKKQKLVEQAQALQDSTEWKSTSDKLIALQKEWKTIGMVPKKLGDQLWNDFLSACNKFFEARNAANAGTRSAERENLARKRDIIAQLKALADEAGDNLQEKVQQLVDEYQSVGHVPFKEKDKLYAEYHAVLDKLYKDLNISIARRRLDSFKSNLKQMADKGANALDNERARLMRRYETLKQEIQTYENNLGFLNASSKKGNSLIDEMNRKVQKLKDDCELVKQKIKAIDAESPE